MLAASAKRREVLGESHEKVNCVLCKEGPLVRRTFSHMDDSVEPIDLFSGVATSRDGRIERPPLPVHYPRFQTLRVEGGEAHVKKKRARDPPSIYIREKQHLTAKKTRQNGKKARSTL